jgi:hypothetical protein
MVAALFLLALSEAAPADVVEFDTEPFDLPPELTSPGALSDGGEIRIVYGQSVGQDRLTRINRSGEEVWSFETPSGLPSISPDGQRVAIVNREGLTMLAVDDGAVQWALDRYTARALRWSSDGASIAHTGPLDNGGIQHTVLRAATGQVITSVNSKESPGVTARIDSFAGEWIVTLGMAPSLSRLSAEGLEPCKWEHGHGIPFNLRKQAYAATPSGGVYRWEGCDQEPTRVAALSPPVTRYALPEGGAGSPRATEQRDWLRNVRIIGDDMWVTTVVGTWRVDSDWSWEQPLRLGPRCDQYAVSDDATRMACIVGGSIGAIQFYEPGSPPTAPVSPAEPGGQLDRLEWRFLSDKTTLVGFGPDDTVAVVRVGDPMVGRASSTSGFRDGPSGLSTFRRGTVAHWDGTRFVPTASVSPCRVPKAWLFDDGVPVVDCGYGLQRIDAGETDPMSPSFEGRGKLLIDLPGVGRFARLGREIEVIDGTNLREPTEDEARQIAIARDARTKRRVPEDRASWTATRQEVFRDGVGGVAPPLKGELARSPDRQWALRLEGGRFVARRDPLVFEPYGTPRIRWVDPRPDAGTMAHANRTLQICAAWADTPVALNGVPLEFYPDRPILPDDVSADVKACLERQLSSLRSLQTSSTIEVR